MNIARIAALLSLALPSFGFAQITVTYNFDVLGDETTASLVEGAHFTPSAFGYSGTGTLSFQSGTGGSGNYAASATGWNVPGNYFTFSIALDPGYVFQGTQLSFDGRVTSTGPVNLEVFSSADNFENSIQSFIPASIGSFDHYTINLTESGLITDHLEIRIHGGGAPQGTGTFRVDNVSLTGTITAVPEPATAAFLIGIVMLIPLVWNRATKQLHNDPKSASFR